MRQIVPAYALNFPHQSVVSRLGMKDGHVRIVDFSEAFKGEYLGLSIVKQAIDNDELLFDMEIKRVQGNIQENKKAINHSFNVMSSSSEGGAATQEFIKRMKSLGFKL